MLSRIVIKLAAPCNLNCSYCYEYNAGDETWRSKPKFMSAALSASVGKRMLEYAAPREIRRFGVALHGGEPLLVGHKNLNEIIHSIRNAAAPLAVEFSLQSNATLIDSDFCRLFRELNVVVGVSLDGGIEHNRQRVDRRRRPTWERAAKGISILRAEAPAQFGGILSVVDFDSDPAEVLDELAKFEPKQIDFLQPFASRDLPAVEQWTLAHRYGDWMAAGIRHWLETPTLHGIKVRLFEDAIRAVASGRPRTDWLSTKPSQYLVVETDGSYNLLDSLKILGPQSVLTRSLGCGVVDTTVEAAVAIGNAKLAEMGAFSLPRGCKHCEWSSVCSGGYLPSRYSTEAKFDNPSVYCDGIKKMLNSCAEAVGLNAKTN